MLIVEASEEDDKQVATARVAHADRRTTVKVLDASHGRLEQVGKWARKPEKYSTIAVSFHDRYTR
jgi:hypothetical protein